MDSGLVRLTVVVAVAIVHAASTTPPSLATQLDDPPRSDGVDSRRQTTPSGICNIKVINHTIGYFRSQLQTKKPNLIHFRILFRHHRWNATSNSFKPNKWVWTYKSANGLYPYLFWNIDYSILSFGLLDAKTLNNGHDMYVRLRASSKCSITLGTTETTAAIGRALGGLVEALVRENDAFMEYDDSYFCYLAESHYSYKSISYQLAVYLLYPISYINYQCCRTVHNYTSDKFDVICDAKQIEKWAQCTIGPYILGIIIFLYFPILMFQSCSWVSSEEKIIPLDYETIAPRSTVHSDTDEGRGYNDDEWVYLNGEAPYELTDLLSHLWCGLNKTWPITISRIRRLLTAWLVIPAAVYIHIVVYYCTMLDDVKRLVQLRTPMGFLSILADEEFQGNAFATILGGPKTIIIMYYSISVLFIVLPRSLKQIVEDGMPTQSSPFKSPLFLSVRDIKRLSMVEGSLEPGYVKGVTMFKCGIYMLLNVQFWKFVFKTQLERMYDNTQMSSLTFKFVLKIVATPFYIVLCLFEILICTTLYGLPLFMFILTMVRGATRSLGDFRTYAMGRIETRLLRKLLFDNPIVRVVVFLCTAALLLLYSYAACLVFIETFQFISEIIVFCFVAVIVYPSVSFGYLFFFVVLIYYIIRRVRDFGDGYLELLSDAVEISRNLDGQPNYVTFFGEAMMIANVKTPTPGIKTIRINNTTINVAENELQTDMNKTDGRTKIKLVDSVYVIPRDLFNFLIKRHRPAHQQVFKITFNIALIVVLVFLTMSISSKYVSGPTSGISEVMHVIFIVAVGALPRVLEVALASSSETVKKDIQLRKLELSIVEFWKNGT